MHIFRMGIHMTGSINRINRQYRSAWKNLMLPGFVACAMIYSCTPRQKQTEIRTEIRSAPALVQLKDTGHAFSARSVQWYNNYWNAMHKRVHYSGVTLIAKNDSFYVWYAGEADSGKRLNPALPMQIASISKTLCATSVMILYHRKKIKLTDTLRLFFPELPYYNITVEQLLSHSSGLPEYTWFCDALWKDSGQIDNAKLIRLMASQHPENYFRPGKRHRYTNTNFVLLASIVEKLSGLSYPEFLKQNIFIPLGMSQTRVLPAGTDFNTLEVKGHYGNGNIFEPHYQDGTYGDKNIVSTVWDLYRFFLGLKNNKLFPEPVRNEMFHTRWPDARRGTAYALGWRKRITLGDTWMFHSGWWHGYRTNLYMDFKHNSCAVILSNRLSGGFIPAQTISGFFHPEIWPEIEKKWGLKQFEIIEED